MYAFDEIKNRVENLKSILMKLKKQTVKLQTPFRLR